MILAQLQDIITIKRRTSTGSDALNNPIYGAPTSGVGWATVYTNMKVKLAFHQKTTSYVSTGERVIPSGVMYYMPAYALKPQDRVITSDGIEYVVLGVVSARIVGPVIDHYEAELALP